MSVEEFMKQLESIVERQNKDEIIKFYIQNYDAFSWTVIRDYGDPVVLKKYEDLMAQADAIVY